MNCTHLWSGRLEEISWWVPKWWHACFYLHFENWQIIEKNKHMKFLRGSKLKSQRNLAHGGILVPKVWWQNVLELYTSLAMTKWVLCLLGLGRATSSGLASAITVLHNQNFLATFPQRDCCRIAETLHRNSPEMVIHKDTPENNIAGHSFFI